MLEKIRQALAEQLNLDENLINEDTNFKDDLGLDSLDLFELITALEEEYSIDLPVEELTDIETVNDIMEYLKDKGVED